MNVDMAGLAARSDQPRVGARAAGQIAHRHQLRRMAVLCVALLAKHWPRRIQQTLEIRAMWIVAVEAALAHGSVLEQKRTALLGMAAVTHIIDAVGLQQRRSGGAVRVVAIDAADLALEQRHVGALVELRTLHLVAGKAGLTDGFTRRQAVR